MRLLRPSLYQGLLYNTCIARNLPCGHGNVRHITHVKDRNKYAAFTIDPVIHSHNQRGHSAS